MCSGLSTWCFTFVVPYLINTDQANLGAKSALIFAGTSLLAVLWVWWEVPESMGKDFAALDFLYESGTPTRRFKGASVPALEPTGKQGLAM